MHVFSAQQHITTQVQEGLADLGCAQPCSTQGVVKGHSVLHTFSAYFSERECLVFPLFLGNFLFCNTGMHIWEMDVLGAG